MNTKHVQNVIRHAEAHCRERGARLTKKRKQVLTSLLGSEKALSAYELVDVYHADCGESMPAMSMYRILDFLQDEHLVHRLNLANKYVACAHIACHHEHAVPQFLICRDCQKVEEISIDKSTILELQKSVDSAGFHLLSPQLEMSCLCDGCADSLP